MKKGFTLLEVMISLMLVLLVMLFVSGVMIYSLDGLKKSRLRLIISQRLEEDKNRLLSKSFDAPELYPKHWINKEGLFQFSGDIRDIEPTLKRIQLTMSYRTFTQKMIFYKSMHIQEVRND